VADDVTFVRWPAQNTDRLIEKFRWPTTEARDKAAKKWRSTAEKNMAGLNKDASERRIICTSGDTFRDVRKLSQVLIQQTRMDLFEGTNLDGQMGETSLFGQPSIADSQDTQALARYLGVARTLTFAAGPQILTMGCAHAHQWLSHVTGLGWQHVDLPSWAPETFREDLFLSTLGASRIHQEYRDWRSNEGGLHEDLVAFLDGFLSARALDEKREPLVDRGMAYACVQFRALGVLAPERMPMATVLLIDRMEKELNMDVLNGKNRMGSQTYGFVRAAWDHRILGLTSKETSTLAAATKKRSL
jgi:hypothetical protein